MPFSDARGDLRARRVPKGAKCAARDPGRAARGDARRNLSSLSGLIWRPSAIVADARVPGASRRAPRCESLWRPRDAPRAEKERVVTQVPNLDWNKDWQRRYVRSASSPNVKKSEKNACSLRIHKRLATPGGSPHSLPHATQVRGLRKASMASASRLPSAGCMSYCHLAVRGRDMRMDSMRPPVRNPKVVPRSYTRLNST